MNKGVCIVCKKTFFHSRKAKYCSFECRLECSRKKRREKNSQKEMKKTCLACGKTFKTYRKNQVYDTKKCRIASYNKRYEDGYYSIQEQTLRFKILVRDKFICQYCGRSPQEGVILHVDHIKSRSKGGEDTKENLITTCEDCNLGKSDKDYIGEIVTYLKKKNFDIKKD